MKQKTRQIIAIVALAAFIVFTVFGTVGLVISSSHSCHGVHCRTCERITAIKTVVGMMKYAVLFALVLGVLCHARNLFAAKKPSAFDFYTAVSLKTKLNR